MPGVVYGRPVTVKHAEILCAIASLHLHNFHRSKTDARDCF